MLALRNRSIARYASCGPPRVALPGMAGNALIIAQSGRRCAEARYLIPMTIESGPTRCSTRVC